MHLSKRAQSLLEYCLIITMAGVSVILMGPYVIRAVNAHLRGWDDSVQDSANDAMVTAGGGGLPTPVCTCQPGVELGCQLSGCGVTQMLVRTACNPVGCCDASGTCEGEACVSHASCCGPPVFAGPCDGSTPGGINCAAWERPAIANCGAGATQESCVFDIACGGFSCQGSAAIPNASVCAGDTVGLPGPASYQLVDFCTSGTWCELTCDAGFYKQVNVCVPEFPCYMCQWQGGACTSTMQMSAGGVCPTGFSPVDPVNCAGQCPTLTGCRAMAKEDDCNPNTCGFAANQCNERACGVPLGCCGNGWSCASNEVESFKYCEGNCQAGGNNDNARVKLCCPSATPFQLTVQTSDRWSVPGPCGGATPYEIAYWCDDTSGSPCNNNEDSRNRVCSNVPYTCSVLTCQNTQTCNACGGGQLAISWCQGNCSGDDANVTLCCPL